VLAHGAGAGMAHRSMEAIAAGLGERGIATLRYQFPYMEKASKRRIRGGCPRRGARCGGRAGAMLCRAAADRRRQIVRGRMTSQAQAIAPLAGVRGLAVFRLSIASGRQAFQRFGQNIWPIFAFPCCFCRGTRDALAELKLLEPVVDSLGPSAALHLAREADHSFHVLARSGRHDGEVMNEILDRVRGLGRRALWQMTLMIVERFLMLRAPR